MRFLSRCSAVIAVIVLLLAAPVSSSANMLSDDELYYQMTAQFEDANYEDAYELCKQLYGSSKTYKDTFYYYCYLDAVCRLLPERRYREAYDSLQFIPEGQFGKTAAYSHYLKALICEESGDYDAALEMLNTAVREGILEAYDRILLLQDYRKHSALIIDMHDTGSTAADAALPEAREFFLGLARDGDSTAAYYVGMSYTSFIFKRDAYGDREATSRPLSGSSDSTAFEWFTKAAEGGNSSAMYMLGLSRQWGRGCAADRKTAGKWFIRAAEAGNTEAILQAYSYESKDNKNPSAAFAWALKGAQAGSVHCMCLVGDAYYAGVGVNKSPKDALAWYQKALEYDGWENTACLIRVQELLQALGSS